jgi:hypothetical protein
VEKHGTARQATDDNIVRCMRFACWITKATNTQKIQYLLLFHGNNGGDVKVPQCYFNTRTACLVTTEMERLLHGTNWVFKYNILRFILKGLNNQRLPPNKTRIFFYFRLI